MALKTCFNEDLLLECGCDEAGRGCLAGDLYAAAVVWPKEINHPLLKDSKQLSAAQREEMRLFIEHHALSWAIGIASVEEIGTLNILHASFLAMHRAIDQLTITPDLLLIDGNRFDPHPSGIDYRCIVKGDNCFTSIAAASILAKQHRDCYMERMAKRHPQYHWEDNKGYPTAAHREAIKKYGLTKLHRKGFRQLKDQPEKLPKQEPKR